MGLDDAPLVEPASADEWRAWLEAHHASASGAWLVTRRPAAGPAALTYDQAVEEALCVGWVDGQAGRVDDERSKLYFSSRKPRSGWARSNKERVERLLASGRMRPAGIAAIERAKADGSWTLLDGAERLEVPADLAAALDARPPARGHWDAFPPSVRRAALAWLATARRAETRARRIERVAARAARNERPLDSRPGG